MSELICAKHGVAFVPLPSWGLTRGLVRQCPACVDVTRIKIRLELDRFRRSRAVNLTGLFDGLEIQTPAQG